MNVVIGTEYLTCYDDWTGAAHFIIRARSAEEVRERYPTLLVNGPADESLWDPKFLDRLRSWPAPHVHPLEPVASRDPAGQAAFLAFREEVRSEYTANPSSRVGQPQHLVFWADVRDDAILRRQIAAWGPPPDRRRSY